MIDKHDMYFAVRLHMVHVTIYFEIPGEALTFKETRDTLGLADEYFVYKEILFPLATGRLLNRVYVLDEMKRLIFCPPRNIENRLQPRRVIGTGDAYLRYTAE